jgi:hypothetical protein
MTRPALALLLLALVSPAGAEEILPGLPEALPPPDLDDPGLAAVAPADAFFGAIGALCGHAFAGTLREDTPATPGAPFAGPLAIEVTDCDEDSVRIPFHVGADRTRTWELTRTAHGLRLKHHHVHADGSPDVLTLYGGESVGPGSATRQEFPADAESIALFRREGRDASTRNTWALELVPGQTLAYEMTRPDGRRFEVVFDLTRPLPAPTAAPAR